MSLNNPGLLYFNLLANYIEPNNLEIMSIFSKITKNKTDERSQAQAVFQYVLRYKYVLDIDDYWQSVNETINIKQGDCEDLAVLLSSLLYNIPIPNWILVFGDPTWVQYHMANLIKIDNDFLLLDTTQEHAFGKMPNYEGSPQVFTFFSGIQPFSNPVMTVFSVPLTDLLSNGELFKLVNLQL